MESLKGQFLIASTHLRDPNFFRTVVLMVQHDKHGAMGLVLNRPTEMTIKDAWEQVSDSPCEREDRLYSGGPCEGVLAVVHTQSDASEIEVLPGIHFAATADNVSRLAMGGGATARFFVGYAGWAPGQLENEVNAGAWLSAPATQARIFEDGQNLWRSLIKEISWAAVAAGLNPKVVPTDPSMN
jgi:putative transcriptional regulator